MKGARLLPASRVAVGLAFVAVGALLLLSPRLLGLEWSAGSILVDLGSEFVGLALTVWILDWFFEQRRLRAEGRRLAWEVFHRVERVTWIWLGGPLRMETDELLALLGTVRSGDKVAPCTEDLLLGLGIRSRELMKGETQAVGVIAGLGDALGELSGLARIGEGKHPSPGAIAEALLSSARPLAKILNLSATSIPARLIRNREPDPAAQERRFASGNV